MEKERKIKEARIRAVATENEHHANADWIVKQKKN